MNTKNFNEFNWENYNWPFFLKIVHYDINEIPKENRKIFILQKIYFYIFLLIILSDISIHFILLILKIESLTFIILIFFSLILFPIACILLILPYRGFFYNFELIKYYYIIQIMVWFFYFIYIILNRDSFILKFFFTKEYYYVLYFIHFIAIVIYLIMSFIGFIQFALLIKKYKIKLYNFYS